MKKVKIIGLTCVGLLLVFSLTNVANAQVPSYVGVNTGDTYIWAATADMAAVNSTMNGLIGAENWTMVYDMLNGMVENGTGQSIGTFAGVGLKIDVTNMTEEMPFTIYPFSQIPGVGLYTNMSVAYEPNNWTLLMSGPSFVILDPTYIAQDNWHWYLSSYFFHPKGLNYNQMATWMALNFTNMPPFGAPNMTVTGIGDGIRFTFLGSFLEDMANELSNGSFPITGLSDIVAEAKWNSNGVFSYASVAYGGLTLATIQLVAGGGNEVPGFVIPLVLGTTVAAMICTIYIIKKKKRIL
ncbi:MAG: hypothetical protein ACFFCI_18390 [Promethearchaeota archaeon]